MPISSIHEPPDPLEIEVRQVSKHRPGRPVTFERKIPIGQGKKETICIRATEAGARFLKENLSYYARECRGNAQAIQQSELWKFLKLWEERLTKRKVMMEEIRHTLVQNGPWIQAFSERVSRRSSDVKREDSVVLDHILAAAKQAGRDPAKFYSQTGRLLRSPLQAYLIELCRGGGYWWTYHNLITPFDIVQKELAVSRSRSYGDKRGVASLYRRYLGPQWKTLMTGSPESMPHQVRRLLSR